ncbi:MAG: hypothetical protein ACNS61_05565 [Candidatus Wenzhouxiangella sp. M2_3B_020]
MAKTSYGHGDEDKGKQRWIDSTLDARNNAELAMQECTSPIIPNNTCIDVHNIVISLNAAILRYRNHIAAKSESLTIDWDRTLCKVSTPVGGEYDAGMTDEWGEYDLSNIWHRVEWQPTPVNPATLRKTWGGGREVTISLLLDHGEMQETRTETVYLTPNACAHVFEHLDKCLENLGWLPEAAEVDVQAEEVLR